MEKQKLKGIVIMQAITKLLELDHDNKVLWLSMDRNGKVRDSQMEDFVYLHESLYSDEYKGDIIINILANGEGFMSWNGIQNGNDVKPNDDNV